MKASATIAKSQESAAPLKIRRTRVFSSPVRLILGSFLLLVAFVSFLGFVWFSGTLLINGNRADGILALGLLAVFGMSRLLAFLNNEKLHCSLCHGTILHEKRCRKHADAVRIPGLSYRAATAASVLCTGAFRCMYCGTTYRLHKKS